MRIGSHGDKRASGRAGGRGGTPAAVVTLGVCAVLTAILAPITSASANPLEEVTAGSQAALEEVVNTAVPPAVTSPAVPPPSPPVSIPQPSVKTPPVSVPPVQEAIPSLPTPQTASKPSPRAPHGSEPGHGSSSGGKIASPDPPSTAAVPTPNSAIPERSSQPPVDLGRKVSPRPPAVSPGIAARRWFIHIWPAVSLGYIGRALIGGTFDALGLGSLTAPSLTVGLLSAISGLQPTAIRPRHLGVLGEEEASKGGEPIGEPSVGPIRSNPETVAFVILASLMALAALVVGSELSVFRRYRRW